MWRARYCGGGWSPAVSSYREESRCHPRIRGEPDGAGRPRWLSWPRSRPVERAGTSSQAGRAHLPPRPPNRLPPSPTGSRPSVGFNPLAAWYRFTGRRATASRSSSRFGRGPSSRKGTPSPNSIVPRIGCRRCRSRGRNWPRRPRHATRPSAAGDQKILAAKAELTQAQANKASDLAAVDAKIEYLKLGATTARAGVQRLDKLRASGVKVADEDYDKAKLLAAQAEAELKATEAVRTKTATTYEQGEKAAKAKVEAAEAELAEALARAPIESSKDKLKLAEQLSARTTLRGTDRRDGPAAVTGREGQPTGVEPILQMADLSKMTAVAEVYESDVERLAAWVHAGPVKAEVKNPALPHPLNGEVKSDQDIARMIAKNQVFAMGPREDADRRVVQVTVHLDNAAAADAGRFVGTASDRHTGTEQVTPFSLAWSNLAHKRGRTAIAAGGSRVRGHPDLHGAGSAWRSEPHRHDAVRQSPFRSAPHSRPNTST